MRLKSITESKQIHTFLAWPISHWPAQLNLAKLEAALTSQLKLQKKEQKTIFGALKMQDERNSYSLFITFTFDGQFVWKKSANQIKSN